jgi:hypothetical protein
MLMMEGEEEDQTVDLCRFLVGERRGRRLGAQPDTDDDG